MLTRVLVCFALALPGCTGQVDSGEAEEVASQTQAIANSACPSSFHSAWVRGAGTCTLQRQFTVGVHYSLPTNSVATAGQEDFGLFFHPLGGSSIDFAQYGYESEGLLKSEDFPPTSMSWGGIYKLPAGSSATSSTCGGLIQSFINGAPHIPYTDDHFGREVLDVNRVYCMANRDTTAIYRVDPISVAPGGNAVIVKIYYQQAVPESKTRMSASGNAQTVSIGSGNMSMQTTDLGYRSTLGGILNTEMGLSRRWTRVFYRHHREPASWHSEIFTGEDSWAPGYEGRVSATGDTTASTVYVSVYNMMRQVRFGTSLADNWINYGFAIAGARALNDSIANQQTQHWSLTPEWISIDVGQAAPPERLNSGYEFGSALFEGLEVRAGCTRACVFGAWRNLKASHPGVESVTVAQIKAAIKAQLASSKWASVDYVFAKMGL